jgi:two-component system, cell cycle sensor histidine kinase and response regulator CckA
MSSSNIEQEISSADAAHVQAGHVMENKDCFHGQGLSATSYAETILLVEDESFVREVTREVLESAGYQIFSARNAAEASNIFEQSESLIDLLLTDVILPGESGRLLGAKLRQMNPGLKILYVTGYAEQMGSKGMDIDCLAKPFSTDTLLGRVRQILD